MLAKENNKHFLFDLFRRAVRLQNKNSFSYKITLENELFWILNPIHLSSSASRATKENQGNSKLIGESNERPDLLPEIQENSPPLHLVRKSYKKLTDS